MENIFYNRHWLDVSPSQSENEWQGRIKVCLVQQQNKKRLSNNCAPIWESGFSLQCNMVSKTAASSCNANKIGTVKESIKKFLYGRLPSLKITQLNKQ